jgi:hypothetical protein
MLLSRELAYSLEAAPMSWRAIVDQARVKAYFFMYIMRHLYLYSQLLYSTSSLHEESRTDF